MLSAGGRDPAAKACVQAIGGCFVMEHMRRARWVALEVFLPMEHHARQLLSSIVPTS